VERRLSFLLWVIDDLRGGGSHRQTIDECGIKETGAADCTARLQQGGLQMDRKRRLKVMGGTPDMDMDIGICSGRQPASPRLE
jgi:hypothetical protein